MTPADLRELADGLTDAQRRVIPHMSDGDFVYPCAQIAADAGVPVSEARKVLRELRASGLAVHGVLWNEGDGCPHGSGTWLTNLGLSLRDHLMEQSNG